MKLCGQSRRKGNVQTKEERRARRREYYDKNRVHILEYNTGRYQTIGKKKRKDDPVSAMLAGAKQRAKEQGIPFSVIHSDVVIPERCPVFGVLFNLTAEERKESYSPHLDRIIPEKGYVPGNIAIISARANRIKSNASVEELESILAYMRKYNTDK